jgi:hypothetical protein
MFPNHRFRKAVLIIGGSTDLGKKLTDRFAKPLLKRWNVFNIDTEPYKGASSNYEIDFSDPKALDWESLKKIKD